VSTGIPTGTSTFNCAVRRLLSNGFRMIGPGLRYMSPLMASAASEYKRRKGPPKGSGLGNGDTSNKMEMPQTNGDTSNKFLRVPSPETVFEVRLLHLQHMYDVRLTHARPIQASGHPVRRGFQTNIFQIKHGNGSFQETSS